MLLLADASDLKKIDIRNLRGSEMTEENLYKIYRNGLFLPLVLNSRWYTWSNLGLTQNAVLFNKLFKLLAQ